MKIGRIEQNFKKANDWLNHTGQGVKDQESIEKVVKGYCPEYVVLQDIMLEKPSVNPLALSEGSPNHGCDDPESSSEDDEVGESDEDPPEKLSTVCKNNRKMTSSVSTNSSNKKRAAQNVTTIHSEQGPIEEWSDFVENSNEYNTERLAHRKEESTNLQEYNSRCLSIQKQQFQLSASKDKLEKQKLESEIANLKQGQLNMRLNARAALEARSEITMEN